MLIHNRSAATARISDTCRIGRISSARLRTASMASTAYRRGNRYSDCSSSPLLGPRACPAQLRRTGARVESEDRVPVDCCRGRSEEITLYLLGHISDPALDPDLINCLTPAGKDADA